MSILTKIDITQNLPRSSRLCVVTHISADATSNDASIKLDDETQFFNTYVEQKKQVHGANSFVESGTNYQHQLDMLSFITIVTLEGKTENGIALDLIACIN